MWVPHSSQSVACFLRGTSCMVIEIEQLTAYVIRWWSNRGRYRWQWTIQVRSTRIQLRDGLLYEIYCSVRSPSPRSTISPVQCWGNQQFVSFGHLQSRWRLATVEGLNALQRPRSSELWHLISTFEKSKEHNTYPWTKGVPHESWVQVQ